MLTKLVLAIRERYHPLFHLRKLRLFRQATKFLDRPIAIHFDGINHPVYVSLSKNLSWVLSNGRAGEEAERTNFLNIVGIGSFKTLWDVGANVGLYGFLFASAVKDGSVLMFEPDQANTRLIKATIARSSLKSVGLIEAAVSDVTGNINFQLDEVTGATGTLNAADSSFIVRHHDTMPTTVTVSCVTLDGIANDVSLPPDFIKIDVEGAELRVFWGADATIKRYSPAIFFECDTDQGVIRTHLLGRGYHLFDFETMKESESVPHNCLALHGTHHAKIIEAVRKSACQSNSTEYGSRAEKLGKTH